MVTAINDLVEVAEPADEKDEWELPIQRPSRVTTEPTGMKIQGVGNLLTHLAQCCRPVPGDDDIYFAWENPGMNPVNISSSVITSYSIHYTKLYELGGPPGSLKA